MIADELRRAKLRQIKDFRREAKGTCGQNPGNKCCTRSGRKGVYGLDVLSGHSGNDSTKPSKITAGKAARCTPLPPDEDEAKHLQCAA